MNNLDKKLEDYINEKFSTPGEIYHYTKIKKYDDICRSKYLILNSHLFLNEKDPENKELQPAINLIKSKLKDHIELSSSIEKFEEFMDRGIIYYTCSFSGIKSTALARKYGNYCIEFKNEWVANFASSNRLTLSSNVIYEESKQEEIVNSIFEIYDSTVDRSSDILFIHLLRIIPLLKHSQHKHDEEGRIVQIEGYDKDTGKLITSRISKKIFFTDNDILNVYRFNIT